MNLKQIFPQLGVAQIQIGRSIILIGLQVTRPRSVAMEGLTVPDDLVDGSCFHVNILPFIAISI
jgi:hypothetical protein